MLPSKRRRIHDLRWPERSVRLIARCRVRQRLTVVKDEPVARPGADVGQAHRVVTVALFLLLEGDIAMPGVFFDAKGYLSRLRCPNAEMYGTVRLNFSAGCVSSA